MVYGKTEEYSFTLKKEEKWIGIFLAFQSQSWCTDEEGHARVPVEHCDYKGE